MTWQKNTAKEEWIERCGVAAGLPLFESAKSQAQSAEPRTLSPMRHALSDSIPDWIWSGNGIKAEVYEKMQSKFALDSFDYLNAIILLGGKATDHQVKEYFNDAEQWPLHIVSARRNYFCNGDYPIISSYPGATIIGPKGKPNTVWYVNFNRLYKIIYQQ